LTWNVTFVSTKSYFCGNVARNLKYICETNRQNFASIINFVSMIERSSLRSITSTLGQKELAQMHRSAIVLRPNPKSFLMKWKDWEGKDYGRTLFRNCLAGIRIEARVANRTQMAPEYGLTSRKDAMPFSKNSLIVGPAFESRNLIPLTWDWITCDLWRREGGCKVLKFNYEK